MRSPTTWWFKSMIVFMIVSWIFWSGSAIMIMLTVPIFPPFRKLFKHRWYKDCVIFILSWPTRNFSKSFELIMFVSFVSCNLFTYREHVIWIEWTLPFFVVLPLSYLLPGQLSIYLGFFILLFFLLEFFHLRKELLMMKWFFLSIIFSFVQLV